MSKTMLLKVAVLASAGLVLSGCGSLSPGVAVEVGDETISTQRIDTAAEHYCTAVTEQLEADGTQLPMGLLRKIAVERLTVRSIADQLADEYDVKAGPAFHTALADAEQRAESLPEEVREDYVALSTANPYANAILEQVGQAKLAEDGVEDPTPEEIGLAGVDAFESWPDAHGLEFDPRFGLETIEGRLAALDTNTSTAVSDNALMGLDVEVNPAYVESLPERHRCG